MDAQPIARSKIMGEREKTTLLAGACASAIQNRLEIVVHVRHSGADALLPVIAEAGAIFFVPVSVKDAA